MQFKSTRVKNWIEPQRKRYTVSAFHTATARIEFDPQNRRWYAGLDTTDGWKRWTRDSFKNKRDALALAKIILRAHVELEMKKDKPQSKTAFVEANNNMSSHRAYEVLGLPNGASVEDVKKRHGELTKKLHPDIGGSNFLMVQVNLARDVILSTKEALFSFK